MPRRRQPATARVAVPFQPGLRLHAEGERYATLLKERERLLRAINGKKQKLERVLIESSTKRGAVLDQLSPFLARYEATTAQLRDLFDELLAPGRLSASAAKQVARVRHSMAVLGFLGELDEAPVDPDEHQRGDSDWPGERSGDPEFFPRDSDRGSERHREREVSSAQQRGQGKNQESLRTTFRRLVAACHPDRAANEAEREQRTATMKEATQAYERGDLARLLQLEQAWQRGQSLASVSSTEANCRELERAVRELRAQSGQLQKELRAAEAAASLSAIDEPILQALEEAKADVEQLEAVRDFVVSFREGKIGLREFVAGPRPLQVDEELEALFNEMLAEQDSNAGKRRKRPRAKKRSASP
jgi:hypothetical protein